MNYFYWISGCILALAWSSRLIAAGLGMSKIADISRPEWDRNPGESDSAPRVSIIVPACNEQHDIAQTLTRLLALDYSSCEIIAVNDRSTDRTGDVMDSILANANAGSRLKVIHIEKLPERWLGKAHAMWTAASQANGDWLLFTDADVLFKPDSVRRALAYAEAEKADHLVVFPRMIMKQPGEKMMIAFFQTLFVFGHRPWKVADPKTKDHMGVGAFNMIRREVYDSVGTYKSLRFEVLDDMKLGKIVKESGYRQRNVFGDDLITIRWAKGAMGVVDNLTKNSFAILSFQWPRVLLSVIALLFLNLLPFIGVLFAHGWTKVPHAIALLSMFSIYVGMSWKSAVPAYYFLLHPISTMLFAYTMMRSMTLALWDGGVTWRGTKYPLDELRRGMV
jgi:cellulose synthase/poly-beta-1,6-N-acetylglucosamine synthase-like glycosyltransferase